MPRRIVTPDPSIPPRPDRSIEEYRRLASAVLIRAYQDAQTGDPGARHFMAGGAPLSFWCAMAGISTTAVIARTAQVMRESAEIRRKAAAA